MYKIIPLSWGKHVIVFILFFFNPSFPHWNTEFLHKENYMEVDVAGGGGGGDGPISGIWIERRC